MLNISFGMGSINIKPYLPLILFFTFIAAWMILAYRIGDWKNWRLYYPTILFFWCGDLIYNVLFYQKPLWVFVNPTFSHYFTDMICAFLIFTCTVLIYIPCYPKRFKYQILYIGYWVLIYTAIEWLFFILGGIAYRNGWSLRWSAVHNVYQFILLKIHHDRPILAWTLAFVILFIIAFIFEVPIINIR